MHTFIRFPALALTCALLAAPSLPATEDLREAQRFWATLDSVWKELDAGAFQELFTDDPSFAFVDRGVNLEPHVAIDRHFRDQFSRQALDLRHVSEVRAVRAVARGVLGGDVPIEVSRVGHEDAAPVLLRRFDLFTVMRHTGDRWQIQLLRAYAMPIGQTPRMADTLPADLRETMAAFDRAQVSADTALLARLVADDYVLVNSDATVDRKAKYLSDFLLPGIRMEPYVIDQRVEKVSGDVAIVFGLQRLAWMQDGQRHRRDLRIVHVWTKRSGRWQVTHTQLTRIPE